MTPVFVSVSAGEAKVYEAIYHSDIEYIISQINDSCMEDIINLDDFNAEYKHIEHAKKALQSILDSYIRDFMDDRFEAGTGFTIVLVHDLLL